MKIDDLNGKNQGQLEELKLKYEILDLSQEKKGSTEALKFWAGPVLGILSILSTVFLFYSDKYFKNEESIRTHKTDSLKESASEEKNYFLEYVRADSVGRLKLCDGLQLKTFGNELETMLLSECNEIKKAFERKKNFLENQSQQLLNPLLSKKNEKLSRALNEMDRLEAAKSTSTSQRRIEIEKEKQEIIKDIPEITDLIDKSTQIEEKEREVTKIDLALDKSTVSDKAIQSETNWVKPGYYRLFGDLRIWLTDLDGNGGTLKLLSSDGKNVYKEVRFNTGDKESVTVNGKRYLIQFARIGRAGNNPFNKALWYTIAQYN